MPNSHANKEMTDKVVLVTGAGSGIGEATAECFAAAGAQVALADRNEPEAARVAKVIVASGGQAMAEGLDVTSERDWESAISRILSAWNRLDVCVNCAGIAFAKPLAETSLAEWRQVMATNLDGVFLGTRHAMNAMKSGGGGCIVNIASAAGVRALPGNAAYGTSKAAIRFLTRVAAVEGAPHHIRVNSISPGAVATPMWELMDWWPAHLAAKGGHEAALKALVAERGFAEPEEIARAVLFLASDNARLLTGADLPMDAGFTAA
jgi:3(or 17)beta-hydroxysteroid dehydrogenase